MKMDAKIQERVKGDKEDKISILLFDSGHSCGNPGSRRYAAVVVAVFYSEQN